MDEKTTARFWAKVESGAPDECWEWRGARSTGGYGRMCVAGRIRPATHISLHIAGRPLGPGQLARHSCDNPPCVNPAHLGAGDQLANMGDARARGRTARGNRHGRRVLTEQQVVELRQRRYGGESLASIARAFGISQAGASLVARGLKWPDAPGPLTPRDKRWDGK